MLKYAYLIGKAQAYFDIGCADTARGLMKQALVGDLFSAKPALVAKSLAQRAVIGKTKAQMREIADIETPVWRTKGLFDLPGLVVNSVRGTSNNADRFIERPQIFERPFNT